VVRNNRLIVGVVAAGLLAAGCGDSGSDTASGTTETTSAASGDASAVLAESRNQSFPEFTDSTELTNEWFSLTNVDRYELVGTDEGKAYRAEIVLTGDTRQIEWAGGTTEVVVARHRSYAEGELVEEAIDYYAQGDDGGIWYFGEDVDYYENGKLTGHEGAWLAGQDGALPGLLLPGDPEVGQVWWSEDFPAAGIEERDESIQLDASVDTPDGPRDDGLLVRALQDDGVTEEKTYVTGIGVVSETAPDSDLHLSA
jgi:hypothetical protein